MDEVHNYLGKVDRGRATRKVDPEQPALSPEAETLRQSGAIDKANAYERLMKVK